MRPSFHNFQHIAIHLRLDILIINSFAVELQHIFPIQFDPMELKSAMERRENVFHTYTHV